MSFLPVDEQMKLIRRGTEEIIPEDDLKIKLEKSKETKTPLIIKLGCDPSRPDLHIGHGVVLRKLRHFQDLGHQAVLVIGDFTAMIGDPSGRNKTRPQISLEETKVNAATYVEQSKAILDISKLKIYYNSKWLNKLNFNDIEPEIMESVGYVVKLEQAKECNASSRILKYNYDNECFDRLR